MLNYDYDYAYLIKTNRVKPKNEGQKSFAKYCIGFYRTGILEKVREYRISR